MTWDRVQQVPTLLQRADYGVAAIGNFDLEASQMDLGLETSESNGSTILTVRGEVDVYTAPRLRERLVELAGEGHYRVVVDLEAVDFLDSTGLGVLVGGLKRLRSHEGDLVLVSTQRRILKVFEITGLTKVFSIYDSVEAATRG